MPGLSSMIEHTVCTW